MEREPMLTEPSDWEGQHSGVASANAGLDIVMPDGGWWGGNLTNAVNNGSVSLDRLNDMVSRQLASYYLLGQDEDFPAVGVYNNLQQHTPINVQGDHANLIREIGSAGTVLVKNVNNTLPLKDPRFLAVYGYDATVKADITTWLNPTRYGGGKDIEVRCVEIITHTMQVMKSTLAGIRSMAHSSLEAGVVAVHLLTL